MDIVDYIPFGRENAVTRTQLRIMTGMNDRKIRDKISEAEIQLFLTCRMAKVISGHFRKKDILLKLMINRKQQD